MVTIYDICYMLCGGRSMIYGIWPSIFCILVEDLAKAYPAETFPNANPYPYAELVNASNLT